MQPVAGNLGASKERSFDGKLYIPGFHIFLNKEDAVKYGGGNLIGYSLVKVKFREVLAFGTNYCGASSGPCVVTRYMKVVEVLK